MNNQENNRIKKFGEVFTSEKDIDAMLNLVKNETQRLDSRFMEPACGDGNFLIKILERKMKIVVEKYGNSQIEYERYAFQVIASLYGVEILEDNVVHCRERLFVYFKKNYENIFLKTFNKKFLSSIKFIISRNIIWGDSLTLKKPNKDEAIIFSEWSFVKGSLIQRSDYTLANLLSYRPFGEDSKVLGRRLVTIS
jgi:hypothetical protein